MRGAPNGNARVTLHPGWRQRLHPTCLAISRLLDLSLQAVVDDLKRPDINQFSPELRNLILFDRSATARHLGTIMVLDEAGNVRLNSRTLTPTPVNLADRDYFQAQKNNGAIGMYISRPFITRTSKEQVIGVSRRLSHTDGSFAGVVVGTLQTLVLATVV